MAFGLALIFASTWDAFAADAPTTTTPPDVPPTVQTGSNGSILKIDGRLFMGIIDSDANGAYPNRALDIPDAKLRFTFTPRKDFTIVNRFSNNKATGNGFDYFYLDLNNWGGALPGHALRMGKVKEDIGEETWTDNPVEGVLITNSASAVGGYDGGINFRGSLPIGMPASYSLSVLNGTGGVGSSNNGLATGAKIGIAPYKHFYLSVSGYDSGDDIKFGGAVIAPALKVANLQTVPAGATSWHRTLWEVDARWNYGTTGIKSLIPGGANPSRCQLATAYGQAKDNFTGATDRTANYWYAEGLVNATGRLYFASRYSTVQLNDGQTATLVDSTVAVNRYSRVSLGAGFHLTPLTDLKAEYTRNTTNGGTSKPDLNQLAIGLATKF